MAARRQDTVSEVDHDRVAPFSLFRRPGDHSFKLTLPTHFVVSDHGISKYEPRKLFFSELYLVPEFYSIHANTATLDSRQDRRTLTTFNWYVRYGFEQTPYPELPNQGHRFTHKKTSSPITVPDLLRNINLFFDGQRPSCYKHPGVFLDWIDLELDDHKTLVPAVAEILYGVDYNPSLHFNNVLPPSAQTVSPDVNPYLLPPLDGDFHERRRIRMWIAPNHKVIFSNLKLLEQLGFSERHAVVRNRQHHIINTSTEEWLTVVADKEASSAEPDTESKMHITIVQREVITSEISFSVVNSDLYNLSTFSTMIVRHFTTWFSNINLNLSLRYDTTLKIFSFHFPPSANSVLAYLEVCPDPELSTRLNYGLVDSITSITKIVVPTNQEAEVLAKTLAFDTGCVFVTARSAASSVDTPHATNTLAVLYPGLSGTMTLAPLSTSACHPPPFVRVPKYALGSGSVDLDFDLWTFTTKNQPIYLEWQCGYFVNGILTSRV